MALCWNISTYYIHEIATTNGPKHQVYAFVNTFTIYGLFNFHFTIVSLKINIAIKGSCLKFVKTFNGDHYDWLKLHTTLA